MSNSMKRRRKRERLESAIPPPKSGWDLIAPFWPAKRASQIGLCLLMLVVGALIVVPDNFGERVIALFDHVPRPTAPASADVAFLADPLTLSLDEPFKHSHAATVRVRADVRKGTIRPLSEGSLISHDLRDGYFVDLFTNRLKLERVVPDAPRFEPGRVGQYELQFDTGGMILLGEVVADFPSDTTRLVGNTKIRLRYMDGQALRSEDVVVDIILRKSSN